MAQYQVLYWHDIPVQVKAKVRRKRHSIELPLRFQEAVDRAAMRAKLTGTDAYLDGFSWSEMKSREGSPEEVAEAVSAEIIAQHPEVDWHATSEMLRAQRKANES